MDINILGKPISYNPENDVISFRLMFISPDMQEELEDSVENGKPTRIKFKHKRKLSITEQQRKKFFVDLTKILKAMDVYPNANNKKKYYDKLKLKLFPAEELEVDGQIRFLPCSINDLDVDQANEIIERNREIHNYLDIEWED